MRLPGVAGLDERPPGPGGPTVVGALADGVTWPRGDAERVFEQRTSDGRVVATLDRDGRDGYRLVTPGFGRFAIAADGREVRAGADGTAPWRWQRMLLGHALPLAGVLRGVEMLHASGVVLPGGAVGIAAPSFGGKTSVVVHLVRLGAAFLTDDALCVRLDRGTPVAEPGGGTANVRTAEVEQSRSAGLALPGAVVGRDGDSLRVALPRGEAAPLRAMYFLDRSGAADDLRFSVRRPDVRPLLAANLNFAVTTPARLTRQLEVCAAIADRCLLVDVAVPHSVSAAALAQALLDHAA